MCPKVLCCVCSLCIYVHICAYMCGCLNPMIPAFQCLPCGYDHSCQIRPTHTDQCKLVALLKTSFPGTWQGGTTCPSAPCLQLLLFQVNLHASSVQRKGPIMCIKSSHPRCRGEENWARARERLQARCHAATFCTIICCCQFLHKQ